MVVVCGIFFFTLHVLHSGAFQREMMVCRYIWIQNE